MDKDEVQLKQRINKAVELDLPLLEKRLRWVENRVYKDALKQQFGSNYSNSSALSIDGHCLLLELDAKLSQILEILLKDD